MVSIHTFRPLDFSSFPTVLLFATILRLGLNVASTRIVLSAGHTGPDAAGKVIESFGEFVIAGNYVVGFIIFMILMIIIMMMIIHHRIDHHDDLDQDDDHLLKYIVCVFSNVQYGTRLVHKIQQYF